MLACNHLRNFFSQSKYYVRNFGSGRIIKQQFQDEASETEDAKLKLRLPPCQMSNMMDIGSRSIFDEDQDIFRSSVRRFMRDELAPVHHKYEAQGHVDREVWNRVGEQGFLGVCIPAEDGGIGGSFKDEAIVLEEQIYANCHAPAIGVWIHSGPENFKKSRQKKNS